MSAEFTYNSDAQTLINMGIFMLIYFVLAMGVAITFYVLKSLGLYTIAAFWRAAFPTSTSMWSRVKSNPSAK